MTPFYQLLTNGGNYLGEFSNSEMQWKYFNQRQIIFRYRRATVKGSPPIKKNAFFRALPDLPFPPTPPSPQFGQLVPLFLDVKNDVLARITEPSKDDYDNDVSDNCDHNFGTFDDFGV